MRCEAQFTACTSLDQWYSEVRDREGDGEGEREKEIERRRGKWREGEGTGERGRARGRRRGEKRYKDGTIFPVRCMQLTGPESFANCS